MIWFLLLLFLAATVYIDSAPLFLLGLLAMAIYVCPQAVLPSLGAMLWWVIKSNLRR